jgi:hypothetical protein
MTCIKHPGYIAYIQINHQVYYRLSLVDENKQQSLGDESKPYTVQVESKAKVMRELVPKIIWID